MATEDRGFVRIVNDHILEIHNMKVTGDIFNSNNKFPLSENISYVKLINCLIFGNLHISNFNDNSDLEFCNCSDSGQESTVIVESDVCLRAMAMSNCVLTNTTLNYKGSLEEWPEISSAGTIIKGICIDKKAKIGRLNLYVQGIKQVKIGGSVSHLFLNTREKKCTLHIDPTANIEQAELVCEIESAYFQSLPRRTDVYCKAKSIVFYGSSRFSFKEEPVINITYRAYIDRLSLGYGCSGIEVNFKGVQEGKLRYVRISVEDLSKFSFSDCDFSKTEMEFISLVTNVGIKCANMKWPNKLKLIYTIDSLRSEPASPEQLARFYRSIKNSSDESGDVDSKLKFSYLEKNEILKSKYRELISDFKFILLSFMDFTSPFLSQKFMKPSRSYKGLYDSVKFLINNFVDFILLLLSLIISKHCTNLVLPIIWLLSTPIIVFAFSDMIDIGAISVIVDKDSSCCLNYQFFKEVYPLLLDPTHKIPTDPKIYASNIGLFQSLSSRVLISIFLYHIIKSFRKYHDK